MMTLPDAHQLQTYLASLPAHEALLVKQRLNKFRRDCGCGISSIVMLSITASWLVYTFLVPVAGRSWQHTTALGLMVLFASALFGKLIGLGLARVRLHIEIRRLRRRLHSSIAQKL